LGNFYDLKGNILKAKYRQISQNSYFVEVEEGEEQKGMPVIFAGIQPDVLKNENGNFTLEFKEKILVPRISKRIFSISSKYIVKNIKSNLEFSKYDIGEFIIFVFDINTLKTYSTFEMYISIELENKNQ
ncbi:MAG: hypothetical protein N2Z20_00670, partial [Elusimicrobiales bacterium]|nr:hypothetical protein [Elusimicrobiales bacterium]